MEFQVGDAFSAHQPRLKQAESTFRPGKFVIASDKLIKGNDRPKR